jgi:hypothetical protein
MTSHSLAAMDNPPGRTVKPPASRPALTHHPKSSCPATGRILDYLVRYRVHSCYIGDITQSEEVFYRSKMSPAESRQIIRFT